MPARASLTGLAIVATTLAARSGRRLEQALAADGPPAGAKPKEGVGTKENREAEEAREASADTAGLERRTRMLQVAVPVLTGALLAMDSLMGEQQRPAQVLRGTAQRVLPDAIAGRLVA